MTISYDQYKNMIHKRAINYSTDWRYGSMLMDVEDLVSAGHEIFLDSLHSFDPNVNPNFGTHLWHQLGRMKDIVEKEQYRSKCRTPFDDVAATLITGMDQITGWESLYKDDLSEDACKVLEAVLKRVMTKGKHPSPRSVAKVLDWEQDRVEDAWEEIAVWWAHGGRPIMRAEVCLN